MIPFLPLLIELILFGIIVALVFAVDGEVSRFLNQRRRLGPGAGRVSTALPPLTKRVADTPFFRWVRTSTSIRDGEEFQTLTLNLARAGMDHPAGPVWFVVSRFLLAVLLPLIFLLVQRAMGQTASGFGLVLWTLLSCAAGLMLPGIYIKRRVAARQAELEREFPDALDLMVVCIEAGLGLDAAFVRIGQAMGRSHPAIAAELTRLSEELAAGKGRSEAMRAMAMRAGVSSIRSFVALIIQSEMLGASVALTFRTYAAEMRQARYLAAERRAMRIPVLMTLPLVTCILPVIVAALLLPVIIDVVRHLMPALSGVHGVG